MAKQKQRRRSTCRAPTTSPGIATTRGWFRDPATKEIKGVFPQAFELRVKIGERYLSLNWFEFFGDTVPAQYRGVVAALRDKRNVTPRCGIVRLNAAEIMDAGAARGLSLRLRIVPARRTLDMLGSKECHKTIRMETFLFCLLIRRLSKLERWGKLMRSRPSWRTVASSGVAILEYELGWSKGAYRHQIGFYKRRRNLVERSLLGLDRGL